jgi:methylmalonyl-CoA mutase
MTDLRDQSGDSLPLAAEFPAVSRDDWVRLAQAALKGKPIEELTRKSYDGLPIDPLAPRRTDAPAISGRTPGLPWQVMQRVDHPDPAAANAEALRDLENGATGLALTFAGAIGAYDYGLPTGTDALARALVGVVLDAGIALDLDLSIAAREAPPQLAALIRQRRIDPAAVQLRCGLDPLRSLATQGASPLTLPELGALLVKLVKDLTGQGFKGPFTVADGRVIHNAGGSEVQELAYVLATGIAYLRMLEAGGIALDAAQRMLYVRMSADADQFLTMAKFRALRKLWVRAEQACGLTPAPIFVAAETAWRMLTRRDPYTNMLRATIATAAAGLGGADAVTVLPFTLGLGLPDRFARRIARNTHLVLLEESNLAKVADPAAGSGGIEALTDQLCQAAWSEFHEIEGSGGACEELETGLIQCKVAAVRAAREAAVATRRDPLVGTGEFAELAEATVAVRDAPRAAVAPAPAKVLSAEPLPRVRFAEPYESLRDAADRVFASAGIRPKVILATLGTPAEFTPRASFARNFFAAGGIEAVEMDAGSAVEQVAGELACLCSSDEVYAREAVSAAESLRAASAKHLYLAGRPRHPAPFAAAGVGTFIFAGCDALATLRSAHDILGIR